MKHFDRRRWHEVREVYNAAWEKNWGFVPMTEAGDRAHGQGAEAGGRSRLRPLRRDARARPVGFTLALPDVNQALKKANGRLFPFGLVRMLIDSKKIHALRVLTLGVVPEYRRTAHRHDALPAPLPDGAAQGDARRESSPGSWRTTSLIRRALERLGARVYKTYRLYDYPLTP